jgi:hypothetical protein
MRTRIEDCKKYGFLMSLIIDRKECWSSEIKSFLNARFPSIKDKQIPQMINKLKERNYIRIKQTKSRGRYGNDYQYVPNFEELFDKYLELFKLTAAYNHYETSEQNSKYEAVSLFAQTLEFYSGINYSSMNVEELESYPANTIRSMLESFRDTSAINYILPIERTDFYKHIKNIRMNLRNEEKTNTKH